MKRVNTKIIDLLMYVIGLYSRKKSVVTCDGVFCGYAYSGYPVRRYLWTAVLFGAMVAGLIID
ncbi:hypothetical protein [Selenomonas ruminantium]|uniref:Uncharacterized protein n=1 Tax=Selenomonas ruminantium TaxID=971 RepID=A0A1I0YCF6_SELRU|nr:hypothetical protein [Selenomonas ruminantium]SFB10068.1 hypothetical protein SAMN05216587_11128 [Selenomonas ruminantium]